MERIVLITTGQPSTNPRMVKEYTALRGAGYDVKVVYSYWAHWALKTDAAFFSGDVDPGDFILAGGSPARHSIEYFYSRVLFRVFKRLAKVSGLCTKYAHARPTFFLRKYALKIPAKLYIAHNLGALPAAAVAAKKNRAVFAFDAEDYHRGQTSDKNEARAVALIEDKYIPLAVYLSTASPIMCELYRRHYSQLKPILINNVFSLKQQPAYNPMPVQEGSVLRLFWFSQSIGLNRGVQDVIDAANLISDFSIEITLMGNADEEILRRFRERLTTARHEIIFKQPITESELIKESAHHHIGLALEPGFSVNNDAALSNKIMTYLLAGNAIVASATSAQKQFIDANPLVGLLYSSGDVEQLARILTDLYLNPARLETMRMNAYALAQNNMNWEKEQEIFLDAVNKACQKKF